MENKILTTMELLAQKNEMETRTADRKPSERATRGNNGRRYRCLYESDSSASVRHEETTIYRRQ